MASWEHTKENGTLITTAPYSSSSCDAWPNIKVLELRVQHLPKGMPSEIGETKDGISTLKALRADVIDFDNPEAPTRIQNVNNRKQIVLRLGRSYSNVQDNLPSGAGSGSNNAVDLTDQEMKGCQVENPIEIPSDSEGEGEES